MFKQRHRGGEFTWDLLSPEKTREVKKREQGEIYPKLGDLRCCNLCPAFLDSVVKQYEVLNKTTPPTHFHRHGITGGPSRYLSLSSVTTTKSATCEAVTSVLCFQALGRPFT